MSGFGFGHMPPSQGVCGNNRNTAFHNITSHLASENLLRRPVVPQQTAQTFDNGVNTESQVTLVSGVASEIRHTEPVMQILDAPKISFGYENILKNNSAVNISNNVHGIQSGVPNLSFEIPKTAAQTNWSDPIASIEKITRTSQARVEDPRPISASVGDTFMLNNQNYVQQQQQMLPYFAQSGAFDMRDVMHALQRTQFNNISNTNNNTMGFERHYQFPTTLQPPTQELMNEVDLLNMVSNEELPSIPTPELLHPEQQQTQQSFNSIQIEQDQHFSILYPNWNTVPIGREDLFSNVSLNYDIEHLALDKSVQDFLSQVPAYSFHQENPYCGFDMENVSALLSGGTTLAKRILLLEAYIRSAPTSIPHWIALGKCLQENENDSMSISAFAEALRQQESCIDGWRGLTTSFFNENVHSRAYYAYNKWIENLKFMREAKTLSDSDKAKLYVHQLVAKALGYSMSDNNQSALPYLKQALEIEGSDYSILNMTGAVLANSSNPEGALEFYKKALVANPDFVRARFNASISLITLGKAQEAAREILRGLESQHGEPNFFVWRCLRIIGSMLNSGELLDCCEAEDMTGAHDILSTML